MERKKLILMGAPSVGKSSLVAKCVYGIFSEIYMSTIGVKIDKKELKSGDRDVMLQIWDLAGAAELKGPTLAYIRGADACLLVSDGTRAETLRIALGLRRQVHDAVGDIPFALAINKLDLESSWTITAEDMQKIQDEGLKIFKTSAKSGEQVEEAFLYLATAALAVEGRQVAS